MRNIFPPSPPLHIVITEEITNISFSSVVIQSSPSIVLQKVYYVFLVPVILEMQIVFNEN